MAEIVQNPAIDEEQDTFLIYINKKLRNINKKLKDIEQLEDKRP